MAQPCESWEIFSIVQDSQAPFRVLQSRKRAARTAKIRILSLKSTSYGFETFWKRMTQTVEARAAGETLEISLSLECQAVDEKFSNVVSSKQKGILEFCDKFCSVYGATPVQSLVVVNWCASWQRCVVMCYVHVQSKVVQFWRPAFISPTKRTQSFCIHTTLVPIAIRKTTRPTNKILWRAHVAFLSYVSTESICEAAQALIALSTQSCTTCTQTFTLNTHGTQFFCRKAIDSFWYSSNSWCSRARAVPPTSRIPWSLRIMSQGEIASWTARCHTSISLTIPLNEKFFHRMEWENNLPELARESGVWVWVFKWVPKQTNYFWCNSSFSHPFSRFTTFSSSVLGGCIKDSRLWRSGFVFRFSNGNVFVRVCVRPTQNQTVG